MMRRARERLKMSQEEFARSLGEHLGHPVSQSQISDWERGRFEPGASVLFGIAEIANMSIDELRGAGPSALVERFERLEDEVGRLTARDGEAGGDLAARLTSVEQEIARIGGLLAQMIGVLDHAGLWHVGPADSHGVPGSAPAARTRRRRTAGSE